MYYSAGTYESFAHPEKPKGVDKKSAYVIGTGLAGLTAAFYLVRDGQMKGETFTFLKSLSLPAAAATAIKTSPRVSICAAAEKWTTISRLCGTPSVMFPP